MKLFSTAIAATAMLAGVAAVMPAKADRDDWRRDQRHGRQWERNHSWGPAYYAPPPVYVAPPAYSYYTPPPVYNYGNPGVSIGVTIR